MVFVGTSSFLSEKKNLIRVANIWLGVFQNVDGITTEGVNVDAMFARETVLDINRLFCNNIHDMAKYYGIEAANKTIVREITNVFSVSLFGILFKAPVNE